MKKLLVLQEIDPTFILDMFDELTISKDDDVSCVIFGGGTDVNPELYGESRSAYTQVPDVRRDAHEKDIFNWAKEKGIPMIGICRGAQLLTVLNGGKLIQHVHGHAGTGIHQLRLENGDVLPANSYHHQMMFPYNLPEADWKLLGWAHHRMSDVYCGFNTTDVFTSWGMPINFRDNFKEPEIVFYPKTKSLGIQGHPEWANKKHQFVQTCRKYIAEYLLNNDTKRASSG